MGSYDGAETCELVGCYLLSQLTQIPEISINPPFNKNVQTDIGRMFINLIDKCFPTGHKLKKIFNRNTIKLSYSCTLNMKQVIDGHNKAMIKKTTKPEEDQPKKMCNCRNETECPLEGGCLSSMIKRVLGQPNFSPQTNATQ